MSRILIMLASMTLATACHRHADRLAHEPDVIAFVGVSVVRPDADTVVPDQTVVAAGGRIVALGPAASTRVPADALVIPATGLFLLPGLHDMHVHHFGTGDSEEGYTEPDLALYLAAGVTTVRIMHGTPAALRARERISAGRLLGPRLVVCSPQITGSRWGTTPDEVTAAVRRFHEDGYDCIKLYSGLAPAAFGAALATADELGLPTAGHASPRLPYALLLGLASIEHVEEIQWHLGLRSPTEAEHGARVDSMLAAGVAVVPTIGGFDFTAYLDDARYAGLLARESTAYVPDFLLADRDRNLDFWRARGADLDSLASAWRDMYERALQYTAFFHARGVPLMMGTDAGSALSVPGFAAAIELETMVRAGLSPAAALVTATVTPSDFLDDDAGRIELGRRSDLVLLRNDPLRDVAAVREVEGVLVGTLWFDRLALEALLATTRKR